jgi:sugar/nucleoside kinase (ribokinase family)
MIDRTAARKPILLTGALALDTVDTPFGNSVDAPGGVAYAALAASLFTDVRLLAAVGEDFPATALEQLSAHGVTLSALAQHPGRSFRWAAYYGYDLAQPRTVTTQLNLLEGYTPVVPKTFRSTPYVLLSTADPRTQLTVLDQMAKPTFTLADTMGYWISQDADRVWEVVERADAIIMTDAEARQLTGTAGVISAARKLRDRGPQVVIIRKGEYGTLMLTPDGFFAAPAFPVEEMRDPTGAGDTFAGGVLGYLAYTGCVNRETLRRAVIYGSVLASYAVEEFGVQRLLTLAPGEVMLRYSEMRALTAFGD